MSPGIRLASGSSKKRVAAPEQRAPGGQAREPYSRHLPRSARARIKAVANNPGQQPVGLYVDALRMADLVQETLYPALHRLEQQGGAL